MPKKKQHRRRCCRRTPHRGATVEGRRRRAEGTSS
uniref:Uncharacterized protein n=1 Tax=Arundo donax TaxID=35708 RepID=A0A0A9ATM8_ARUDO